MITTYDNLPVGKYLEICSISKDESRDELERSGGYIAVLGDMTEDEVLALGLTEFADAARRSSFLTGEVPDVALADSYRLGGLELCPVKDIRKMTAGQYIDFQQYSRQAADRLVDILSVFLVPKGARYADGYDMDAVKAAIRDELPVSVAMALQAFFWDSLRQLMVTSLSSSAEEIRRMKNPEKKAMAIRELEKLRDSLKDGAGSILSTL